MILQAPGTILQMLYVRERIRKLKLSNYLEIGCGKGHFSKLFLEEGMRGIALDMNPESVSICNTLNSKFIVQKKFNTIYSDFLDYYSNERFELIFSCMVIEHLQDDDLDAFMKKAIHLLSPKGRIIFIVPARMAYWGIEDDIAGHIKRYDEADIQELGSRYNLTIKHLAGLTFPISNILLGLSNFIVNRKEGYVLNLGQKEKTIYTGNRQVKFKTEFPRLFLPILNPVVLYPFHILQKLFRRSQKAMVIYFEMTK